jgi:hypothetical protein
MPGTNSTNPRDTIVNISDTGTVASDAWAPKKNKTYKGKEMSCLPLTKRNYFHLDVNTTFKLLVLHVLGQLLTYKYKQCV